MNRANTRRTVAWCALITGLFVWAAANYQTSSAAEHRWLCEHTTTEPRCPTSPTTEGTR